MKKTQNKFLQKTNSKRYIRNESVRKRNGVIIMSIYTFYLEDSNVSFVCELSLIHTLSVLASVEHVTHFYIC